MLSQELHTVVISEGKCSRCSVFPSIFALRVNECENPATLWARQKNQYNIFIVQVKRHTDATSYG